MTCAFCGGSWKVHARECPSACPGGHGACWDCLNGHGLLAGPSDYGGMRTLWVCPVSDAFRMAWELMSRPAGAESYAALYYPWVLTEDAGAPA